MKIASLFSGIGGFEEGLSRSLINEKVVFSSEINSHSKKSYKSIYGSEPKGDITEIDINLVPEHDLLVAGFPCQSFSIAGNRKGFDDTRGTLFFEVSRILSSKKPKWFIIENVKNLVSHNNGSTFLRILEILNEIGYSVDFDILNSKYFNTPQSRERLYIVGRLGENKSEYPLSSEKSKVNSIKEKLNKQDHFNKINLFSDIKTSSTFVNMNMVIDKRVGTEYEYDVPLTIKDIFTEPVNKIAKIITLDKDSINDNERQRRIHSPHGLSPTLLARSDAPKFLVNGIIRKLTEYECLKVQGFSEYTIKSLKESGVSKTQIYKQAGNAVSPKVIEQIANAIYRYEKKNQYTFIDLFSGLGGFRIAGEYNGMKCVLSSEIDEAARKNYFKNFGNYPTSDVKLLDKDILPEYDILFAGFPCQPFSIAGLRKGFDDTRGTLFFEIMRISNLSNPAVMLLENVTGIINHDNGNTIKVIRENLKKNYDIYEFSANAKEYGIPQNRDRWYCICFRKNLGVSEFEFIQKRMLKFKMDDVIYRNNDQKYSVSKISSKNIQAHISSDKCVIANNIRPSKCSFSDGVISPCLTAKMGTGGNNVPVIVPQMRKLTVYECLQLMTFPIDYDLEYKMSSYKQVGNSVAVRLITEIVELIVEKLKEIDYGV